MKKISVYKYDTSWIHGLLLFALFTLLLVLASFVVLGSDLAYVVDKSKNKDISPFNYDVIAYPANFVISIFQLFVNVYFIWTFITWIQSYQMSSNDLNRRKFNLNIVIIGGILIFIITIDTLMKLVASFVSFPNYLKHNDASLGIVVGFETWYSYLAKPYIMIGVGLISVGVFLYFYFIQKKKYKDEVQENAKDNVQEHYRNLLKNKSKKQIEKYKQKDLSKKVRVF